MSQSDRGDNESAVTDRFWRAIQSDDAREVRRLLEAGANVNYQDPDLMDTYLTAAIEGENPNIDVVRTLLEFGADPNMRGSAGDTPLSHAVAAGNIPLVDMLLDHGADIDGYSGMDGASSLQVALEQGQPEVFKYLLKRGADPRARDYKGRDVYAKARGMGADLRDYFG